MEYTKEELKNIKDNAAFWGNNCGGCETCSQTFGDKIPEYDFQEAHALVCMIEDLDKQIEKLAECYNLLDSVARKFDDYPRFQEVFEQIAQIMGNK